MKIAGESVELPQNQVIVFPRNNKDIVIIVAPVLDFTNFEKLCPKPTPPIKTFPGGKQVENVEDKGFKDEIDKWARKRLAYMIITSLNATSELEWDTVKKDDHETWLNYEKELGETFSPVEVSKILDAVMTACGLNEELIDEATKNFLASQGEKLN